MSLTVDDSAVKRIEELRIEQGKDALNLRITVDGGGCSGFLYKMELSDEKHDDDVLFSDVVVTDSISIAYLNGSVIRFEEALIGSDFKIDNPNAVAGCGCGSSFSVISQ